ncbi:hypothetical protein AMTRI_Chr12g239980 [Amborella trichopoda]
MAGSAPNLQIHRFPQPKYIDALKWLPPIAAFDRFIVLSLFDPSSDSSSIEIQSLSLSTHSPELHLLSTWPSHSRISCLSVCPFFQKPIIAAASLSGSLHFVVADAIEASIDDGFSVEDKGFHRAGVFSIDLQSSTCECVSAGEDGRINLSKIEGSRVVYGTVFDGKGLVSYTSARWASPWEFATGGLGFGVQFWDQRKPGGPVSQSPAKWYAIVGGSGGTVFAWDLRWQKQPVMLCGGGTADPMAEGEVWKVQYDHYSQSANPSTQIPPVMMCSDDGILAIVEPGEEEPIELLAEPCAINGFDIDPQNPSDLICNLEWEEIAILMRP